MNMLALVVFGVVTLVLVGLLVAISYRHRKRENELRRQLREWREGYVEESKERVTRAKETARRRQPTRPHDFVEYLNQSWRKRRKRD